MCELDFWKGKNFALLFFPELLFRNWTKCRLLLFTEKNTFLDKRIPYVIDDTFNETAVDNIHEAIDNYNVIFENCIKWVPRTSEVKKQSLGRCLKRRLYSQKIHRYFCPRRQSHLQGDRIGQNFTIWAIFYGKFFSRKNHPMMWAKFYPWKNCPKLTFIKLKFCSKRGFLHVAKIFKKFYLLFM